METLGPVAVLAIAIFLVILTIAWIILPFALIGIKPILRELLEEMRKANDLRERGRQEPRF
jgi:hypothetical protein